MEKSLQYYSYKINGYVALLLKIILLVTVGEFFERVSRLNLCYCEDCLKGRKDKKTYMRGDPPKKYTLPTGWARFSLK